MKLIVPFFLLPAVLAAPAADQPRGEPAISLKLRSSLDRTPVDADGVARRLASPGEDKLSKRDPGEVSKLLRQVTSTDISWGMKN